MTKAEIVRGLEQFFQTLPDDAHIDVQTEAGCESRDGDIFVEKTHNGTFTVTIRVNGGAHDTRGLPKYMDRYPELKAFHERVGR